MAAGPGAAGVEAAGAGAAGVEASAAAEGPEGTRPVAGSVRDSEGPGLFWEEAELSGVWTASWSLGWLE